MPNWNELIFSDQPFSEKAAAVFNYQYQHNAVYRRFCDALNVVKKDNMRLWDIPLLPVKAFKEVDVTCRPESDPDLTFKSSGTGDMQRSQHHVHDADLYRRSVLDGFRQFYDLDDAVILGYTPGYAENPHSSLIWMINELIKTDAIKKSRFLPLDEPLNQGEIDDIANSGRRIILFGAAFGLLDLIEISDVTLPSNSVVIETGGMKTHKREMSRFQMHEKIAESFGLNITRVHSEYGMCELLSQAYATGGQWFRSVPWMKVSVRDPQNPQIELPPFQKGLLGVMDLANVYSCAFLLTGDRGVMDKDGRFKVLGRWNPKNMRGCNFLIDKD